MYFDTWSACLRLWSGSSIWPSIKPSPTITATSTPTFTLTSSSTITLTPTPTNTPTLTPTLTPTPRIQLSGENIKQWQVFQTLGGVSGVDVALTPDGKLIAIAKQKSIVFYDTSSLQIQKTIVTNNMVKGLLMSQDGDSLLAMDNSKDVQRYQLPSGKPLGDLTLLKNVTDFCPQGQSLAVDNMGWAWWARLFCLPDQVASFTSNPSLRGLITIEFNANATLAALGGEEGFDLVSLNGNQIGDTKWHTSLSWGEPQLFRRMVKRLPSVSGMA